MNKVNMICIPISHVLVAQSAPSNLSANGDAMPSFVALSPSFRENGPIGERNFLLLFVTISSLSSLICVHVALPVVDYHLCN